MGRFLRLTACLIPWVLLACGDTGTVLLANFDSQPLGPPAAQQQVGTFRIGQPIIGQFGEVAVVQAPKILESVDAGRWVRLTQFDKNAPPARLQGTFGRFPGDGNYLITLIFFIPEGGSGSVHLQTHASSSETPATFFHVLLPTDGTMREPPLFGFPWGRFPHDRKFSMSISLHAGLKSTATVTMLGAAQGSRNFTLSPAASEAARRFEHLSLVTTSTKDGEQFLVKSLTVVHTPSPAPKPGLEQ
jgi:hypothetical protein